MFLEVNLKETFFLGGEVGGEVGVEVAGVGEEGS